MLTGINLSTGCKNFHSNFKDKWRLEKILRMYDIIFEMRLINARSLSDLTVWLLRILGPQTEIIPKWKNEHIIRPIFFFFHFLKQIVADSGIIIPPIYLSNIRQTENFELLLWLRWNCCFFIVFWAFTLFLKKGCVAGPFDRLSSRLSLFFRSQTLFFLSRCSICIWGKKFTEIFGFSIPFL